MRLKSYDLSEGATLRKLEGSFSKHALECIKEGIRF